MENAVVWAPNGAPKPSIPNNATGCIAAIKTARQVIVKRIVDPVRGTVIALRPALTAIDDQALARAALNGIRLASTSHAGRFRQPGRPRRSSMSVSWSRISPRRPTPSRCPTRKAATSAYLRLRFQATNAPPHRAAAHCGARWNGLGHHTFCTKMTTSPAHDCPKSLAAWVAFCLVTGMEGMKVYGRKL